MNSIIRLLSPLAAALCILLANTVYGQTCPDEAQSERTIAVTPEQCYQSNDGQIEISFVNALGIYDALLGDFTPTTGDYEYNLFKLGSGGGYVYDESALSAGLNIVSSIAVSYEAPNKITFTGVPPADGYSIILVGGDCDGSFNSREFRQSDAFGTPVPAATEIIIDPAQISVTDNTVCAPPTPFDGEIDMTGAVSGGAGDYQYSINGVDFQTSPVFSALVHNTYTITVIDQNSTTVGDNCTKTVDVTVGNAQVALTPAITPNDPSVCAGVDLLLDGNPSGGTTNYVTHAWTGDIAALNDPSVQAPTFNTTTPGTYNLTYEVTDDKGCTATSSVTVTVNNSITEAILSGDAAICAGGNTDLAVTITGGTAPYEFTVEGDDGSTFPLTGYNSGDAINVSPITTTIYSITSVVRDANGCEVSGTGDATVNVTDPASDALVVDEEDNSICEGESTNIIVRASEAGYIYQLRNNADDSAIGTPVSGNGNDILLPTGNLSVTTTFNVLVGNGGLCPDVELTDLATVNVAGNVDRTLAVSAQDDPICSGESTSIQLANSENGVTYQLRNDLDDSNVGGTQVGDGTTLAFATGTLTGTTTFNITASNGICTDAELNSTVAVTVNPSPTAAVLSGPTEVCAGSSVDLVVTITDGVGPYTFNITDGTNTTAVTNYNSGDPISVSPTADVTYTIDGTVTDGNTCTVAGSGSVSIVVRQGPTAAAISGDATICEGETTNLQVEITDGAAPYSFTLSDGTAVTNYNSLDNITVSPATNTTYTVPTVQDANGCEVTVTGTATVTVNPRPALSSIDPTNVDVCAGDPAVIRLDGSENGVSYALISSGTTVATLPGDGLPLNFNLAAGSFTDGQTYTIEADNGSCVTPMNGTATVTINTIQTHAITSPAVLAACDGETVTVNLADSDIGVSYELLLDGNPTGVLVNGTGAGISFNLTVTNANNGQPLTIVGRRGGCEQTMTGATTLSVDGPTASISVAPGTTVPENTAVSLTSTVTGGSGPYTYAWTSAPANQIPLAERNDPNPTSELLTATTDFTLRVTDDNGCETISTVQVIVTGGVLAIDAISVTPTTVCAGEEVQLDASVSGGDGDYRYAWTSDNGTTVTHLDDEQPEATANPYH